MGAENILNNTILVPSHDSLVNSHQLPAYNAASKFEGINSSDLTSDHFSCDAYIKIKDASAVKMIAVQEISGFGMERENEQRVNTGGDYVTNLPGTIKYSDITLKHLYTNDSFFLDWLTNGVSQGGSARADIELHFKLSVKSGIGKKHIVFTLYDAFPVSWSIGQMSMTGGKNLTEVVTITFSWVDYKVVPL